MAQAATQFRQVKGRSDAGAHRSTRRNGPLEWGLTHDSEEVTGVPPRGRRRSSREGSADLVWRRRVPGLPRRRPRPDCRGLAMPQPGTVSELAFDAATGRDGHPPLDRSPRPATVSDGEDHIRLGGQNMTDGWSSFSDARHQPHSPRSREAVDFLRLLRTTTAVPKARTGIPRAAIGRMGTDEAESLLAAWAVAGLLAASWAAFHSS